MEEVYYDRSPFFVLTLIFAIVFFFILTFIVNTVFALENDIADIAEPTDLPVVSFTATVGVGVVVDESISGGTVVFESEPN